MELKKDCHCLDTIHTGPHWIHMNNVTKRINYNRLQQSLDKNGGRINQSIFDSFAYQEKLRLQELETNMIKYGVDKIPDELIEVIDLPEIKNNPFGLLEIV